MKRIFLVCGLVALTACGKDDKSGSIGKCEGMGWPGTNFPGITFCADFSYKTDSGKDLTSDARTAAKTLCGNGTWTDSGTCDTTAKAGNCTYNQDKTAGTDKYTLTFRAVFGLGLVGGTPALEADCKAAGGTWSGLF